MKIWVHRLPSKISFFGWRVWTYRVIVADVMYYWNPIVGVIDHKYNKLQLKNKMNKKGIKSIQAEAHISLSLRRFKPTAA